MLTLVCTYTFESLSKALVVRERETNGSQALFRMRSSSGARHWRTWPKRLEQKPSDITRERSTMSE